MQLNLYNVYFSRNMSPFTRVSKKTDFQNAIPFILNVILFLVLVALSQDGELGAVMLR